MVDIDRVLIGDNPFNLVDHFSQERSRLRDPMNASDIAAVIRCALESGATGFVFSSTRRVRAALSAMREDGKNREFGLYPVFPDAYELARSASEGGVVQVAKELMAGSSLFRKTETMLDAGTALLRTDAVKLLRTYLRAELSSLRRIVPAEGRVKAVFLHEILTELIVSFKLDGFLHSYVDFIQDEYHALPGVVTRNFPSFVRFVSDGGFGELAVLTPFNKAGFQMNPSRRDCEESLVNAKSLHVIAMSVMAGGYLSLSESIDYLMSLSTKISCVVGVRSEDHARETFSYLSSRLNPPRMNLSD